MSSEIRTCQNCHKEFTIEPEDFAFYEKIKVPPPTWCPECRLIRRLGWRNERSLYKRNCDLCKKPIISVFSKETGLTVYCSSCWWSDKWDALDYKRDFDFSKPFLLQVRELLQNVPVPNLFTTAATMVNSDYCNMTDHLKNCYLLHYSNFDENSYYGSGVMETKDSIDLYLVKKCELCYEIVNCINCYKTFFSQDCESSNDIYFSRNLVGCSHCFGCTNLRNKQYYIFDKPHTKEQYEQRLKELFNNVSYRDILKYAQNIDNEWKRVPQKYMRGRYNSNVSGDYINNSKNCFSCFDIVNMEDSKFCSFLVTKSAKDCYDFTHYGDNAELVYECLQAGDGISNIKIGWCIWSSVRDVSYSMLTIGSSNIFGCVGIKKKQYCILNKQYSRDKYEEIITKIIDQMNNFPYTDKKGRIYKYGDFFPIELSPFSYNETTAQEYFPLTKEEALKQGYKWKGPEERDIKPEIKTEDLPDHIKDVKDDIIGKVIQCAHAKIKEDGTLEQGCNEQCTTAFKIIPQELQFYRRMNLPLPRLCPNCRHYQRLKQRNPLKLWHRQCMCGGQTSTNGVYKNTIKHFHGNNPCPNEFETTYAPDRPEIVYCEKCYLAEVV